MRANQAEFRIATMARVLGVSPSGYYAWRTRERSAREVSDVALRARASDSRTQPWDVRGAEDSRGAGR